jgi:hypothetical protein
MDFDFIQYSIDEISATDSAFLFAYSPDIDKFYGIGAVYFRWIKWTDHPASHSMEWAWLHPFFRRHGFLTKAWPHFVSRYKSFHVSTPRSEAMQYFLKKIGYVEAIQSTT